LAFAAEGASVVGFGRRAPGLKRLTDDLGEGHMAMAVDVGIEDSVAAAFDDVRARYGRLNVFYNCAGIQLLSRDAPVDRLDLETWLQTMSSNLTGAYLCSKYAVRLMLDSGGGSVIVCGSPTGISGRGWRYHAYSASKAGLVGLTKAMAVAYGPHGIRANLVIPGTVHTGMTDPLYADADRVSELTQRTALRRLAEPDDLVGVAVFLASDESRYATGGTFVVDGGLLVT
jgi:NAD(P)-dependent dehydrogenase (short-subunit alcohol dehydrogenase family)